MTTDAMPKYFVMSLCVHAFVFITLILNVNLSKPLPVVENTNKYDVISVVVLGDVQESRILPQQLIPDTPQLNLSPKKVAERISIKKDVIALKMQEKNRERIAKHLLADIEKQKKKQKQLQQKKLQSQFEKLLRIQAEKSLRQQLLNEDIKLKGTQTRQSQGEINKYKALILQTISEHWLVPIQSNKKLYCELMIRVAPSGMVLDVQVTKSSGDLALDHSARAAVLKSSPLPVPRDSKTFEAFRQFVLKVKPKNVVMNRDGIL
ncbi:MAG TPA: cell envelope integrity protein TolA [Gammaproteobacteria bacterium]|nr:cell envelope integrity protein TolA [Gammaproteobacteria bacterium]